MTCTTCNRSIDSGAQYCSGCGQAIALTSAGSGLVTQRLMRPREGRMIAGVCAGFALRYGWDPSLVRLVLLLAVFLGAGLPIGAYLLAWIVMPNMKYALPAQAGMGTGSMTV